MLLTFDDREPENSWIFASDQSVGRSSRHDGLAQPGGRGTPWIRSIDGTVSYPDMVKRILPFCGSSKTAEHNIVFLEGVKAALTADAAWKDGWYDEQPTKGLRAV